MFGGSSTFSKRASELEAGLIDQPQSLNQAILAATDRFGRYTCFRVKREGRYQNISYRQFEARCLRLTSYLYAEGIAAGERVAIMAENSVEWMVAHIGCLLAGGVVVPLQTTLPPEMLGHILRDCKASFVVIDDASLMQSIEDISTELPQLKTVVLHGEGETLTPGTITLTEILARPLRSEARDTVLRHARGVEPEAVAAIYYTSNETGRATGAMFSQAQRLQTMQHMAEWFMLDTDDLAYTILSWGSPQSLNASLYYLLSGITNVLAEDPSTVEQDLQQTSPTMTLNTPYFFERTYEEIMQDVSNMPHASQEVFRWAVAKGRELQEAGSAAAKELRERYLRADLTFFNRIRGRVGGRLRRLYSVGAPLTPELCDFFEVIGLVPLNVYSVTEAGGFPAASRLTARKRGSCGQTAAGFQISIAEDGEVLVKGPTVMQGYWQRPDDTRQVIDGAGWLHTGDLGYLDEDGYLYLAGRKRAEIVLSTGQKVVPTRIEQALTNSPYIAAAAVFGEGRSHISALIVPDLEALTGSFELDQGGGYTSVETAPGSSISLKWYWQQESDQPVVKVTTAHPEVKQLLDREVGEANLQLGRWERIEVYSLLEEATSPATNQFVELTPAGRRRLAERYASEIEAMYPQLRQIDSAEITQVELSPERLRDLLEKENILDAWLADAGIEFLFELAREKQIDVPSLVHICDAVASLAQMVNEERPLSTAIIVGDPVRIARTLPPSQIQLLRHDHIRRSRHILINLARMVDGSVLGFLVDKHGYLRGVHKLNVSLDEQPSTYLMGPQFRRHAAISGECEAMVFYVPTGGRQVRVFARGELVGRYSDGDWSPESMFRVADAVAKLIAEKNYDLPLVRRLLRCAFAMSEENLGAILVLGDADLILEYSDAPEISHFASIVGADIATVTDDELINFAKQDGATVIDTQGRFRSCMVLLRPDSQTTAEIGPGKGARHSSAAKMSAEAQCLAITVSQDGPITIYESGRQIFSF
jgi:long-chain acyl-CoA synthetase